MESRRLLHILFILVLAFLYVACSDEQNAELTEDDDTANETDDFVTNSKDTIVANAITINFLDDKEVVITNPFSGEGITVAQENGQVVVTSTILDIEVNYVLSGKTMDGSLKIYSDYKFGLILNGVSITSSEGPEINIQSGKKVSVLLVGGTSNRLIDSTVYPENALEDAKATLFSEGQLVFEGLGSLLVKGKSKHAICSDDYIRINGGNITIDASVKDGIHANDYFRMDGGTLDIKSTGDAIDCEEGYITINGGK